MNALDCFTKTYSLLHNYRGVPFWALTPLRRIVRFGANIVLPKYLERIPSTYVQSNHNNKVIVSFTSFPARIENVWLVVECMLRQTLRPAKIFLWLSKEQFPSEESIPQSLRSREGDIFEIRMVEGDIRSHKKYYYIFKECPGALVFLIDDDLYYPTDIIEKSIEEYSKGESSVICNYGFQMKYENSVLLPYKYWRRMVHYSTAPNLFFGSGGGTLIDTTKLNSIATNISLATKLTPIADDIWLNAVVRFSDMRITMLKNGFILPVHNEANVKLASQNLWNNQNDVQLNNVINYFRDSKQMEIFAEDSC